MSVRPVVRAALAASVFVFVGCAQTGASDAPAPVHEPTMEEIMALSQPGDAHAVLQPMIGRFKATITSYMPEGMLQSEGVSQNDWVLGNRFVQSKFTSKMPDGQPPFEGVGLLGHDNSTGLYQGFWIDSMGTMMMPVSSGTYDAATHTLTMRRQLDMPQIGMVGTMEDVTVIESRESHRFSIRMIAPDGTSMPMLDIVYTRM
ncbi:MAG: DUF1579 family protein [Planctomycetes bacterium]|nr:DUF1579 family protein [Planctomycetota bacterium]